VKCVLATNNRHKRDELAAILADAGLDTLALTTLRDHPGVAPAAETGVTFLENARLKALAASQQTGEFALADDSGLVVDALNGAPGIHSARYAGPDARDRDRIEKLLRSMSDVPVANRSARFVCAMVVAGDCGVLLEAEASCAGRVASEPYGGGGFGYDPVFFLPDRGKTMAEVGQDVKNRISHRARAVHMLRDGLLKLMREHG